MTIRPMTTASVIKAHARKKLAKARNNEELRMAAAKEGTTPLRLYFLRARKAETVRKDTGLQAAVLQKLGFRLYNNNWGYGW